MENLMVCPPTRDSKEVEECKELVINIPSDLPPEEWPECCIYRIPKQLRKVNEEAYTPKLVAIGPFHHGEDDLKDMEKHKLKYLDNFLKRSTKKSQADLLKFIKVDEVIIRHCYSDQDCGPKSSDDFVKMILLDAVFIIELFNRKTRHILRKPWLGNGILHDLILLENQLPFFVLEKLYRFACCDEGQQIKEHKEDLKKKKSTFVELSLKYFECYDKEPKSIIEKEVKHFTDLLRYLFCPREMEQRWNNIIKKEWGSKEKSPDSSKKQEEESSGTRFWQFCPPKMKQHWNDIKEKLRSKEKSRDSPKKPKEESFGTRFCATKLDNAGLKFKGVIDDRRLLDIQTPVPGVLRRFPCFGRPMEVPQLAICDFTETLLRNLMALEQCHYPYNAYICNYAVLLDSLIDTEKDVDLLVQKKVIHNQLGSNKIVADLINKLCDYIVLTRRSYFDYIGEKLNEHYEYPLNRTMATLKREYFPNVFRGTATVVGLIVLGFTFWNFLRPFVV